MTELNNGSHHRRQSYRKPATHPNYDERIKLLRDAPYLVARMVTLGLARHNPPEVRYPGRPARKVVEI